LFIMPAIPILIVLAFVLIWFALSPLFKRLGGGVDRVSSYLREEMLNNEEKSRSGVTKVFKGSDSNSSGDANTSNSGGNLHNKG